MGDISINSGVIDAKVSELVNRIQTEIIDASKESEKRIISVIEDSSGAFIDSLREDVSREAAIMNSTGELLIAVANYINSAADAFTNIDTSYNTSKIF